MDVMNAADDEAFLLDLLNSTPTVDGVRHDELDTPQVGRTWLRARGHRGSVDEWRAVRAARAGLQDVVRERQPVSALGALLDRVTYRPTVSATGVEWRLDVPKDHDAAVRAVLAWDGVRRIRPGRLRACENDECTLFLIDRSKPNNARWCSMAVCGNRMKARRHYERTRTAGG